MHGVVWEIFSRSPAAKSVGAEEEVFTDHLHMHNDSLTSCPISFVELVFLCFPFGSRVVTHRCCSQFLAISFECCDRFILGKRDYHLVSQRSTSLNAVVLHVGTALGGISATLAGTRRRW